MEEFRKAFPAVQVGDKTYAVIDKNKYYVEEITGACLVTELEIIGLQSAE